jgi:hypothetical protein
LANTVRGNRGTERIIHKPTNASIYISGSTFEGNSLIHGFIFAEII